MHMVEANIGALAATLIKVSEFGYDGEFLLKIWIGWPKFAPHFAIVNFAAK